MAKKGIALPKPGTIRIDVSAAQIAALIGEGAGVIKRALENRFYGGSPWREELIHDLEELLRLAKCLPR